MEKKEEAPTSFKCDDCKAEVTIIGSDNYQEELRQRAAFKKELAQMEPVEKASVPKEEVLKALNSKRQAFKDQIAQAIEENKITQSENAPN
jgi:hypothetical protein